MSESSEYSASSGAYWLGSRSYHPAMPVPCISPLQIALQMHCVWLQIGLRMHCADASAHRSVLKQLDLIHRQGLQIVLGAFRTSPTQSLYVEAHEPSLTSRCLKLSLNCVLKPKSSPKNPAYSFVSNLKTQDCLKDWSWIIYRNGIRYEGGCFYLGSQPCWH